MEDVSEGRKPFEVRDIFFFCFRLPDGSNLGLVLLPFIVSEKQYTSLWKLPGRDSEMNHLLASTCNAPLQDQDFLSNKLTNSKQTPFAEQIYGFIYKEGSWKSNQGKQRKCYTMFYTHSTHRVV